MQDRKSVLASALFGALTVGATGAANAVPDAPQAWEKCTGINVQAGQNDCAVKGSHVCAGQATVDGGKGEWVYLPAGTCSKIDGEVLAKKPAKS